MPILEKDDVVLDYLETGQGTTVILIHSTVSGNRQWKTLMEDLGRDFRVLAPNLRGYGKTSSWPGERTLNLSDQVQLIEPLIESSEQKCVSDRAFVWRFDSIEGGNEFPGKDRGAPIARTESFLSSQAKSSDGGLS